MISQIDVYLEKQKERHYVGNLKKEGKYFIFTYSESYMHSYNPLVLGPDLPFDKVQHRSLALFPTFSDRIPSKRNPAYKDYCRQVGISSLEKDPLVLLSTVGKKGPSSFIFSGVRENKGEFTFKDLKKIRSELQLTIREFSTLFDISASSIYRIENGKVSSKQILGIVANCKKFPRLGFK